MNNISKADVDQIVERIRNEYRTITTRKELEKMLGQNYTASQRERIWVRYRYQVSRNGDSKMIRNGGTQ